MKQGLLDGSGNGTFDGLGEEFGRTMKIQQKAILDVQNMGAGGERSTHPCTRASLIAWHRPPVR